jgi:phospholipase C
VNVLSQGLLRTLVPFAVVAAISACSGASGTVPQLARSPATSPSHASRIEHFVIVIQENRSFDNLFARFPGARGATSGLMKVYENGKFVDKKVALKPHTLLMNGDISHNRPAFLEAYDDGKLDGFNLVGMRTGMQQMPAGTLAYQYVMESEIKPYWDLAKQYVLADEMFQTQGSGSFIAHQDLIRGGSMITSDKILVDNPDGAPWGCDAAPGVYTEIINARGVYGRGPFPCTDKFPESYPTLRTLLDDKGISWKYYSPDFKGCTGCHPYNPCSICAGGELNAFDMIAAVRYGKEWGTKVSMPDTNIFSDIEHGTLPAVSWLVPDEVDSDHPGAPHDYGPSWVAQVVNAVGKTSAWKNTAIIVVWDDWGGFYDNAVPPKHNDQGGLGFRIPLMVVSPYVHRGMISHTQYEFGSILRCIEDSFDLGRLGTTDGTSNSLCDVFDFHQAPRKFVEIPAEYSLRYFETQPPSGLPGDPE